MNESFIKIDVGNAFACGFAVYWGWRLAAHVWDFVAAVVEGILEE